MTSHFNEAILYQGQANYQIVRYLPHGALDLIELKSCMPLGPTLYRGRRSADGTPWMSKGGPRRQPVIVILEEDLWFVALSDLEIPVGDATEAAHVNICDWNPVWNQVETPQKDTCKHLW